ncbi:hypothetical protein EU91_0070 [Prochlorococcus marinus str. GP2]|uniref:Uncharacterized protein n=1 Tax=Prochlorococcus marinus str. GP2 TaxID=59925 RepID=A0A0A1ZH90_PROMR|nr:hypothetical protein EU91_0070 [Prochlorococcus marinus str. GP2]
MIYIPGFRLFKDDLKIYINSSNLSIKINLFKIKFKKSF